MKIFFYKTLIVFFLGFLLFQLTIGAKISQYKEEIYNLKSKENLEIIKDKIRKELKTAVKKEKYLNDEDSKLIIDFINKIRTELNAQVK